LSKSYAKLAARYARALLKTADSAEAATRFSEQLQMLVSAWEEHPALADSILNPMFKEEERLAALTSVAKSLGADENVLQFLRVVFTRDRISALPEISEQFAELAAEKAKLVRVRMTTARALDDAERYDLERQFSQKIQGTAEFEWSTDASLIGGLVAEFSGRILDGSIRGQLKRLESQLTV